MMKDAKNLASIGENLTPTFADPFRTSDQAISLYYVCKFVGVVTVIRS